MVQHFEEEFGRLRSETPQRDLGRNDVDMNRRKTRSSFRIQSFAQAPIVVEDDDNDMDMAMEIDSLSSPRPTLHPVVVQYPRLIISIDFGTTFSSVAILYLENSDSAKVVEADSIQSIDHYPAMPPGASAASFDNNPTVPTELICWTHKARAVAETSAFSEPPQPRIAGSLQSIWDQAGSEESDDEPPPPASTPTQPNMYGSIWGWDVHRKISGPEPLPGEMKHLTNFKLQLDDSKEGRDLSKDSKNKMRSLKGVKTVDIITEYLTYLLRHARERLPQILEPRRDTAMEFVLCLPTKWTDKAARVMQSALTSAIERSEISTLKDGAIENLFLVAESEAAAAHVLVGEAYASKLTPHEAFLVLDCGGGTVDAVTYTLTQREPVRLKEEVTPEGRSCGSSFLNQGFQQLLKRRLAKATITGTESSLDQIIAAQVQEFESRKRSMNLVTDRNSVTPVYIQGLQVDPSIDIHRRNYLDISRTDMIEEVFKPCLDGVEELMLEQLRQAAAKNLNVQTVILIGGFAGSPTLRGHLGIILRKERNLMRQKIQLLPSRCVDSAVARGGILRALRKEDGPERISRSSYGLVVDVPYDQNDKYHRRADIQIDRADGECFLPNVISWFLNKVGTLLL